MEEMRRYCIVYIILIISSGKLGTTETSLINLEVLCKLEDHKLYNMSEVFTKGLKIPKNFRVLNNVSKLADLTVMWEYQHIRLKDKKRGIIYLLNPDSRYDLILARKYLDISYRIEFPSLLIGLLHQICLSTDRSINYGTYHLYPKEKCYFLSKLMLSQNVKNIKLVQRANAFYILEDYGSYIIHNYPIIAKNKWLSKVLVIRPEIVYETFESFNPKLIIEMDQCVQENTNNLRDYGKKFDKDLYIHMSHVCEVVRSSGLYNMIYSNDWNISSSVKSVPVYNLNSNGNKSRRYIEIIYKSNINHTCNLLDESIEIFDYPIENITSTIKKLANFTLTLTNTMRIDTSNFNIEKCSIYTISLINGKLNEYFIPRDRDLVLKQSTTGTLISSNYANKQELFLSNSCVVKMNCTKRRPSNNKKKCLTTSPLPQIKIWKEIEKC